MAAVSSTVLQFMRDLPHTQRRVTFDPIMWKQTFTPLAAFLYLDQDIEVHGVGVVKRPGRVVLVPWSMLDERAREPWGQYTLETSPWDKLTAIRRARGDHTYVYTNSEYFRNQFGDWRLGDPFLSDLLIAYVCVIAGPDELPCAKMDPGMYHALCMAAFQKYQPDFYRHLIVKATEQFPRQHPWKTIHASIEQELSDWRVIQDGEQWARRVCAEVGYEPRLMDTPTDDARRLKALRHLRLVRTHQSSIQASSERCTPDMEALYLSGWRTHVAMNTERWRLEQMPLAPLVQQQPAIMVECA